LPNGLFSNPKSQFGHILDGLRLKNVAIFYDHLVHFSGLGIMQPEKSGNPAGETVGQNLPGLNEQRGRLCFFFSSKWTRPQT
jgi:hypothetical protein